MRIRLDAPAGQWIKATTVYEKLIATAETKAMRLTARRCKVAGDEQIHAAGFKSSKWELRVIDYPKGSLFSLRPEAWIHSRINFEDVFETGKTISGSPWLWLPLPSVPLWPGDSTRQMSPRKFVDTFGDVLVTIRRPGKSPMLGQKIKRASRAQPFGAFATRAQLRRGTAAKTGVIEVIPLFVGVAVATIQKKFDVHGAMQREFNNSFQKLYRENLEPYEGRV